VLKVKSNINSNSNINISQPKLFTQTVYYFIKRSKLSHFSLPDGGLTPVFSRL